MAFSRCYLWRTHFAFGIKLPSSLRRHRSMLMCEVNKAAPIMWAPLGSDEQSPETWSTSPF